MKIIFTILLALALSGCYQNVNSTDIKYATKQCGGIEKIEEITSYWVGSEGVKCDSKAYEFIKGQ